MITQENYEAYLLDYIEGTLSEKERKEVEKFLRDNPQKAQEMKAYDPEFILPQTTAFVYANKGALKHKPITMLRKVSYIAYSVAAIALVLLVINIFISKPNKSDKQIAKTQNQTIKTQILITENPNQITENGNKETRNANQISKTQTLTTSNSIALPHEQIALTEPQQDTTQLPQTIAEEETPILAVVEDKPQEQITLTQEPEKTITINVREDNSSFIDKLISFFHLRDKVRKTNTDIQFAKEEFIYRSKQTAQQIYYAFANINDKQENNNK